MKILKGLAGKIARLSFSQFSEFFDCELRWWAHYIKGMKADSMEMARGRFVSDVTHEIDVQAMGGVDLSADQVSEIMTHHAGKVRGFAGYPRIRGGILKYAEEASQNRNRIVASEIPMKMEIFVGSRVVLLEGRADRADLRDEENGRPTPREYEIVEKKAMGRLPSREELKDDLQTRIYALLFRDWLKREKGETYLGRMRRRWVSIGSGASKSVAGEVSDEDATKEQVIAGAHRMFDAILSKKFVASPGRRCVGGCPIASKCKVWKDFRDKTGMESAEATIAGYKKIRARAAVLVELLAKQREIIKEQTDRAGGLMRQGRHLAELRVQGGGLPDWYRVGMPAEELEDHLRRDESVVLSIRGDQ